MLEKPVIAQKSTWPDLSFGMGFLELFSLSFFLQTSNCILYYGCKITYLLGEGLHSVSALIIHYCCQNTNI